MRPRLSPFLLAALSTLACEPNPAPRAGGATPRTTDAGQIVRVSPETRRPLRWTPAQIAERLAIAPRPALPALALERQTVERGQQLKVVALSDGLVSFALVDGTGERFKVDAQPVEGVASAALLVPPDATAPLKVSARGEGGEVSRPVALRPVHGPGDLRLAPLKAVLRRGETVTALVSATAADGTPLAGLTVQATLGESAPVSATLDARGRARLTCAVPASARRTSDLCVQSEDGRLSRCAPLLIADGALELTAWPEGGTLVKGHPSRVALQLTDGQGRALAGAGQVLDAKSQVISTFDLDEQGQGVLTVTPADTGDLHASLIKPAGVASLASLPPVRNGGCSLAAVPSEHPWAVTVEVRCVEPHELIVALSTRERLEDAVSLQVEPGQVERLTVETPNRRQAGPARVTLLDEGLLPQGELYRWLGPSPVLSLDAKLSPQGPGRLALSLTARGANGPVATEVLVWAAEADGAPGDGVAVSALLGVFGAPPKPALLAELPNWLARRVPQSALTRALNPLYQGAQPDQQHSWPGVGAGWQAQPLPDPEPVLPTHTGQVQLTAGLKTASNGRLETVLTVPEHTRLVVVEAIGVGTAGRVAQISEGAGAWRPGELSPHSAAHMDPLPPLPTDAPLAGLGRLRCGLDALATEPGLDAALGQVELALAALRWLTASPDAEVAEVLAMQAALEEALAELDARSQGGFGPHSVEAVNALLEARAQGVLKAQELLDRAIEALEASLPPAFSPEAVPAVAALHRAGLAGERETWLTQALGLPDQTAALTALAALGDKALRQKASPRLSALPADAPIATLALALTLATPTDAPALAARLSQAQTGRCGFGRPLDTAAALVALSSQEWMGAR